MRSPIVASRILIVDDDYDIAQTLKVGLEESGYKVDLFTDPKNLFGNLSPVSILYFWWT